MEFDVSKKSFKTLKNVAEAENEVTYEWDVIVPDSKPDIKRIIVADGMCNIRDKEIMQDRAVINGEVAVNIIYEPAENKGVVRSIVSNQSFSYIMELSGVDRETELYLSCRVKRIRASVINSRKVSIICTLEMCGAAVRETEHFYVDGISGGEIEFLKKEINASRELPGRENYLEVSESFEIPVGKPSAEEIVKTCVRLNERDIRPMNGKLLIKGELAVTVIYNGENEGDGTCFCEFLLPFTEMADSEQITDGCIFDGDITVQDLRSEIITNGENEHRVINISAGLLISGRGYENLTLDAVVDAYGREYEVELEREKEAPDGASDFGESRITVKDTIEFTGGEGVNKVINIIGQEYVKSVSSGEGKVTVEGAVNCDILYNSVEGDLPVSFVTRELPFKAEIGVRGAERGSVVRVKTGIVNMGYSIINPTQLEIRSVLDISVHIKNPATEKPLCDITLTSQPSPGKQPGITVCFCDGREKVWDIAKKYKTTVTDIMEINELTCGEDVKQGVKLIIP